MEPLFGIDLVLGVAAIVGGAWFRRRVSRRPPAVLDDRVVALDIASALRIWGAATLLFGALAVSGLPGGFNLPLWSLLALGIGATASAILVLRWRWEEWALTEEDPDPDRAVVESETWQYGVLAAGVAAFAAYFVGLAIGSMQPVHAVVALLEGAAGYVIGLAIATPQTKVRLRRKPVDMQPVRHSTRRRSRPRD